MDEHTLERLATCEVNDKNIFHQLDEIKKEMTDTRQLTIAVKELAVSVKATAEKVDDISDRLSTVEHAPAEDFKHYKRVIIGCIITGTIGIILGAVMTLIIK